MPEPEPRWSIDAVDARLSDPEGGPEQLAAELDLPPERIRRFAKVRELLLSGRAERAAGGTGLSEVALRDAGVEIADIAAYLRIAKRIRGLGEDERGRLTESDTAARSRQPWRGGMSR